MEANAYTVCSKWMYALKQEHRRARLLLSQVLILYQNSYLHTNQSWAEDCTTDIVQDHNESPVSDLLITKTTSKGWHQGTLQSTVYHSPVQIHITSLSIQNFLFHHCTCQLRSHQNSELPLFQRSHKNTYLRKKQHKTKKILPPR